MSPIPQASQLSFLGVAVDKFRAVLLNPVAAAATSITVTNPGATGWGASGFVTIYDYTTGGSLTETKAYSAIAGNVITVTALTNAHPAGCMVIVTTTTAAPTAFIPVRSFEPFDDLMMLEDTNYRGAMVNTYDLIPGVLHGEFQTEGDVFADTFPWWLGAICGDYTASGASAPFSHVFAARNSVGTYGGGQPSSLTISDYSSLTAGGKARNYPGMLVSSLGITFNSEGLLSYSAQCTGFPSGMVAKPTTSFTTQPPLASWIGVTTIAGTANPKVQSGNIDLKRDASVVNTIDGNPAPYTIWLGPLDATGKVTFIAEDEVELNYYLGNTKPVVDFNFQQGLTTAIVGVQIHGTSVAFRNTKVARGGDYLTVESDLVALANTTDAGASGGRSPVKITVKNGTDGSITPYQSG